MDSDRNEVSGGVEKQITLFNKAQDVLEVSLSIEKRIYGNENPEKSVEQAHPMPANRLAVVMEVLDEALRILRKSRDGLDIIK